MSSIAQPAEERKVTICIALIDGPNPNEIVPGARLRFQGLHRQTVFALTLYVTRVLEKRECDLPKGGMELLNEFMTGHEEDGDIFFEGKLSVCSASNANGTGALIQVSRRDLRGLWRKSHQRIAELVPRGNGFIEILE